MQRFYFKSSPFTGFFWDGILLEEVNSDYQNIKVISHPEMGNTLILDDYIMVTQKDEYQYHELITHPNCLQLKHWNKALIIGGGDGLCAEEVLKYPFNEVTLVEIDQTVSEISKKYFNNELKSTFENPRFNGLYQDALKFFPNNDKFDFIALDLNDPAEEFMHSHPLYSGDFYQSCKQSLSKDGIMVVQIGCPYLFTKHFQYNLKLLKSMFKHVAVYGQYMRCYGTYQFFAACSDHVFIDKPDFEIITQNLKNIGLSHLKLYNINMHKGMLMHNNEIIEIMESC